MADYAVCKRKRIVAPVCRRWCLLALLAIGLVAFLLSAFMTHGLTVSKILYYATPDFFSDFFGPLLVCGTGRPQDTTLVYPFFADLFYFFLARCIPAELRCDFETLSIRDSRAGMLTYVVFLIAIIGFFSILCSQKKKGSLFEKLLFVLVVLLCRPAIFAYERGNLLLLTLAFLLFFFMYYDSDSAFCREIALISLAFAAGMKLYPALFGLLLIKEKRWGAAIRAIIYGLLVFFLPSIFFAGLDGPRIAIEKTFSSIAYFQAMFTPGYSISIDTAFMQLHAGMSRPNAMLLANICQYAFFLLVLLSAFLSVSQWKTFFLLTVLSTLATSSTQYYGLLYFVIPLLYFADSEDAFRLTDVVYIAGFALMLTPFVISDPFDVFVRYYLPIVMTLLLVAETIIMYFVRRKAARPKAALAQPDAA